MVITTGQGLLINVTSYIFMLTAYLYLLKQLNINSWWRIFGSVAVIQMFDLIGLIRYEELILIMMLVLLMSKQLIKSLNRRKLWGQIVVSGALAYLTTIISTLLTEIAIMGILTIFGSSFTWLSAVICAFLQLIVGGLILILTVKIRTVLNEAIQRYGYRDLLFVMGGLLGSTVMVIVLVDEFSYLNVPIGYLTLMVLTIFVALFFVVIGCWLFIRILLRQAKIEREQTNQANLAMYTDQLEKNYNEVRQFRHDIKNALLALEIRIDESDDALLTADVQALMQQYHFDAIFSSEIGRFANINNTYIKGIIFSKYVAAQKQGISLTVEVSDDLFDSQQQYFNELRILGILLDNALEAAIAVNQAKVVVSIFRESGHLIYLVKNRVDGSVNIAKIWQRGYSTKGDNRGLGLTTVREIVNQHGNFYLSVKQVSNEFIAQLSVAD